jgi:hypothetical protein
MAKFSKLVTSGYLMNTNNFTLTGKFTQLELSLAAEEFGAVVLETTEKVFSYESLL